MTASKKRPDSKKAKSPRMREWTGWDVDPDAPKKRGAGPRRRVEPAKLDPNEIIERLVGKFPGASQEMARKYLLYKYASGMKPTSLNNTGGAIAKFARALATVGPALDTAAPDELTRAMGILRKGLSDASYELHVTHVRAFYRWLNEGELPNKLSRAMPRGRVVNETETTVVTEPEFRKLLEACIGLPDFGQSRLQALLWALWDTGFRRGELLSLRIKDVTFDDQGGAHLKLPPRSETPLALKTGPREIYVVESAPILSVWLKLHPRKDDPNARLWCAPSDPHLPILPGGLNATLARLCKRAGIRTIHPHEFRHTRATRAARNGWVESKMRHYFGWTRDSDMPSRYIHLANADLDEQVRREATHNFTRLAPPEPKGQENWGVKLREAVAQSMADALRRGGVRGG